MMPSKLTGPRLPVAGQRKLIHQTSDLLATYNNDELKVIHNFLTRIRQLTATCADALSGHHGTASGQSPASG